MKLKVSVTQLEIEDQVKKAISGVRAQFPNLATKSDAQILAAFGTRMDSLRRAYVVQALMEKIVRKDTELKLGHPISPDDFIEASHILVSVTPPVPMSTDPKKPPVADPKEVEKAFAEGKAKAEKIAADIKSGKKTFEASAGEFSEDAGSRFRQPQGSLGLFMKGMMVPEFEKAVFSLEKGKMSEPVRSAFGWHLIRVDRTGKETTAPEREIVVQTFLRSRLQQKAAEILAVAKITTNFPMPAQQNPQMGNR